MLDPVPKKHSGKLSAGFAQSKRWSFTLTQLLIWKARRPYINSTQHQEWNPDPQKRVTELLWARLELLPKPGNFKMHLGDTRAPGRINSPGRFFPYLLWLLSHSSLALAREGRGYSMISTGDAVFSFSNCAGQRCISSSAAHSSHHCRWTMSIWMEKAGSTRNKRIEIFQMDPALALSWDGSESHQQTIVEVTQERKQDHRWEGCDVSHQVTPNPLELNSCTWPCWIQYLQLFTIIEYFLLVLENRHWLSVSSA